MNQLSCEINDQSEPEALTTSAAPGGMRRINRQENQRRVPIGEADLWVSNPERLLALGRVTGDNSLDTAIEAI